MSYPDPFADAAPAFSAGNRTGLPVMASAVPNETYMGNRLTFQPSSTSEFDPVENSKIIRAMLIRAVFLVLAALIGEVVLFLVIGLPSMLVAARSFGSSGSGGLQAFALLAVVWPIVVLALFLFTPVPVQVSEWMLTLDGKADAAPAAIGLMRDVLAERRPPVKDKAVVRVASTGQAPRTYLKLVDGAFTGFVSAFSYGTDLFIGWTFWAAYSPFRLVLTVMKRMTRALMMRGNAIYTGLAYDSAKALREVMHSVVRLGVDQAVTGRLDDRATDQGGLIIADVTI